METPQAVFDTENHREALTLCVRRDYPINLEPSSGVFLVNFTGYQLWQAENQEYVFRAREVSPRRLCVVNPDFSFGNLFVEFSNETTALYPPEGLEQRLFSAWLASKGDLILHASGIKRDEKGYCFIGPSGAGKSTLVGSMQADPEITVLGEDTLILRNIEGEFWIFGTPWHTTPELCSPQGARLEKIFVLDRSLPAGVSLLKPAEGVSKVLRTAVVPYYHKGWLSSVMNRLAELAERVPQYSFSYQLGTDAWEQLRAL